MPQLLTEAMPVRLGAATRPRVRARVAVNGRFRGQQVTGVQRYARELVARLPHAVEIAPRRSLSGVGGHLWEQAALARSLNGALLWSPCNTGPLRVDRQVVTIHDCAFHDHPEAFSPAFVAWYSWLVKRLAHRVRRVITVSQFSRLRLIDYLQIDPTKIVAIANGVDDRFRRPSRAAIENARLLHGLPRRYVLYIGSLEGRKNLPRLLAAWRRLQGRVRDCSLVLCGVRSHVFRDAGLGELPKNVLLAGYVADEHLPALYAGAELFVCPSIYEGFGLTVLEAMACGTPVVCSQTTSLPEVAGEAALLVNPFEVGEIAAGIERMLLDDQLRSDLSTRGLKRANEFRWEHSAERTWQVLAAAAEEE